MCSGKRSSACELFLRLCARLWRRASTGPWSRTSTTAWDATTCSACSSRLECGTHQQASPDRTSLARFSQHTSDLVHFLLPAFLPSSTTLHTTLLAYSFYLKPTSSTGPGSTRRVYLATFFFAFGAIFAWPFVLLLAVPFVLEELFVGGKDILSADPKERLAWRLGRVKRLVGAGLASSLIAVSPAGLAFHPTPTDLGLSRVPARSPSTWSTRTRTAGLRSLRSTSCCTICSTPPAGLPRCMGLSRGRSTCPTCSSTSTCSSPSRSSPCPPSRSRTSLTTAGLDPPSESPRTARRARTRSSRSG